jgi:uncharacterized protein involved in type VI secretion and phage assembly
MQVLQKNGVMLGSVIGLVTDLDDPENLGRVKVKIQGHEGQLSCWARLVSPMAGKDRGLVMRPELDDEVLVAFEQGDPRLPFILGALWSAAAPPPADDGEPGENNWRFIKSRSGHIIKLNDTKGGETIEISDKDNSRRVVMNSANKTIQVQADDGDIEIKAGSGSVRISAAQNVEIMTNGNMDLRAAGALTIRGALVKIDGQ